MRADRRDRNGSRPRSEDYGGGTRSRDKTADSLWAQSASQRAGVAASRELPTSLFSRNSYEAERERKRQLISKMVSFKTDKFVITLCIRSFSNAVLVQCGDKGEDRPSSRPLRIIAPTNGECESQRESKESLRDRRVDPVASAYGAVQRGTTGTPSWSQRPRSANLISSRFEAGVSLLGFLPDKHTIETFVPMRWPLQS